MNTKKTNSRPKPVSEVSRHPRLREVVFQDISNGHCFKIKSAAEASETILWEDGSEYPLVKVEISSASHPAFKAGDKKEPRSSRSEDFRRKYAKAERGSIH